MFPRFSFRSLSSLSRKVIVQAKQNRKFSTYGQQEEGNGLVKSIIFLNVLVTGAWYSSASSGNPSPRFMLENFTLSTHGVLQKHNFHTMITAVFSHASPIHLAFNTFVLHSFGTNVIHALGTARFAFLYMGGGIVSSLAYVIWPYVIPKSWPAYHLHRDEPGLGASGAINSLVMWSVLRWPTSMFYFFGVIPVPAFLAGLGLVAVDAFGLYGGSTNQVGNIAHLGGAAFGAMCFLASKRFRRF